MLQGSLSMPVSDNLIESSSLERCDLNNHQLLAPPPPLPQASCAISVDAEHSISLSVGINSAQDFVFQ